MLWRLRFGAGSVVAWSLAGLLLVALGGWWLAGTPVPALDRTLARAVVRAPDLFEPVLRVVMQLGSFGAVPLAAALVGLRLRRWAPAAAVLVAGGSAYLLSQWAKDMVERPRPTTAVLGTAPRGYASGWSFPSGHATVAFAIAGTVICCIAERPWRVVALAAAVLTAVARVYLGVHFPLDVLAGSILGLSVAGLVAGAGALPTALRSGAPEGVQRASPEG